jgi:hypothetical protein
MRKPVTDTPLKKPSMFTPYVVVWTIFGALSVGYLSVLATSPQWLDDLTPSFASTGSNNSADQDLALQLTADLTHVRDSVTQIQLDLARLRTDVDQMGSRDTNFAAQLAALEQRIVAAPAGTQQVEAQAPTAEPQPAPSAAPKQPKLLNAEKPSPVKSQQSDIETGSVGKTAAAPVGVAVSAPPPVKPASKPVGVYLSSGASLDSLRLNWSVLTDRNGSSLKGLQPRYTKSGDANAPAYDLLAGPVKSRTEAERVCQELAAQDVTCKVTIFGGNAL